jgi:hypothetical protein
MNGPITPPQDVRLVQVVDLDIPFWSMFWTCFKAFVCIGFFSAIVWVINTMMTIAQATPARYP